MEQGSEAPNPTEQLLRELFPDEGGDVAGASSDHGGEQASASDREPGAGSAIPISASAPEDGPHVAAVTADVPVVVAPLRADPAPVADSELLPGSASRHVPMAPDARPAADLDDARRPAGGRRNRLVTGIVASLSVVVVLGLLAYWAGTREEGAEQQASGFAGTASEGSESPAGQAPGETSSGAGDVAPPAAESDDDGGAVDYRAQAVDRDATLDFEVDGTDEMGRPLPALPDVLVPNTPDAEGLPGYHPDPVGVPESGPYTVVHGGRFYLRGSVSSENIRQDLIRRNLLILPLEVLVIEYRIESDEEWYLGDNYPVFLEDDVLFARGSAEVEEQFVPLFEIGANLLLLDPELAIRVTGHTDSQGNDEFNMELSTRRAQAVRAQYLSFGAGENQVIAEGRGETEPIADNRTEEGRRANRRVDFEFVRVEDQVADED